MWGAEELDAIIVTNSVFLISQTKRKIFESSPAQRGAGTKRQDDLRHVSVGSWLDSDGPTRFISVEVAVAGRSAAARWQRRQRRMSVDRLLLLLLLMRMLDAEWHGGWRRTSAQDGLVTFWAAAAETSGKTTDRKYSDAFALCSNYTQLRAAAVHATPFERCQFQTSLNAPIFRFRQGSDLPASLQSCRCCRGYPQRNALPVPRLGNIRERCWASALIIGLFQVDVTILSLNQLIFNLCVTQNFYSPGTGSEKKINEFAYEKIQSWQPHYIIYVSSIKVFREAVLPPSAWPFCLAKKWRTYNVRIIEQILK